MLDSLAFICLYLVPNCLPYTRYAFALAIVQCPAWFSFAISKHNIPCLPPLDLFKFYFTVLSGLGL